jgi:hypothetical protein
MTSRGFCGKENLKLSRGKKRTACRLKKAVNENFR